jgi:hypothetical protein
MSAIQLISAYFIYSWIGSKPFLIHVIPSIAYSYQYFIISITRITGSDGRSKRSSFLEEDFARYEKWSKARRKRRSGQKNTLPPGVLPGYGKGMKGSG